MEKLKKRWNITSNTQLIVILVVFAVTGSSSLKVTSPIIDFFYLESLPIWIFWPVRIILVFISYQILLVFFGWIFGQFQFFWSMEKKILKRFGIKF